MMIYFFYLSRVPGEPHGVEVCLQTAADYSTWMYVDREKIFKMSMMVCSKPPQQHAPVAEPASQPAARGLAMRGCMHGWMVGWMGELFLKRQYHRTIDGWMYVWKEGRMKRWIDKRVVDALVLSTGSAMWSSGSSSTSTCTISPSSSSSWLRPPSAARWGSSSASPCWACRPPRCQTSAGAGSGSALQVLPCSPFCAISLAILLAYWLRRTWSVGVPPALYFNKIFEPWMDAKPHK